MINYFLLGLFCGICCGILIIGYVKFYYDQRKGGTRQRPIKQVVREPDTWPARREALEEKYGLLTREIHFSHYTDDVAANAFFFDDSQTLLLMGQPISYDKIERYSLDFAGVYVIKVWVEGLEGHYTTQSTPNGEAANAFKAEMQRIVGADKEYVITEQWC